MIKAAKKIKQALVTFNLSVLLVCNLIFITAMQIGLVLLVGTVGTWMGWMESGFYSQPYVIAVIAFIFFILIAISVVVVIRFMFVRPLRQMCRAMQELAQGDFSVRMRCEGHWRPLELRQFTAAFNTAAQELGNTEILRKDFINDFSHEFKTPITSLGGFADLLLECGEELTAEERREYLSIISSESHRLADLASNVLLLSRIESQTILTGQTEFDLTEQLRQCVLMTQQKWADRQLQVEPHLSECRCRGSEELLRQVWLNLLDNAFKFSPPGAPLEVGIRPEGGNIAVWVQDAGPGMSQEVQLRIFEQFYQADPSHATAGNGLGLAMVKKIVSLHGGQIQVDSAPGQGSRFTVLLPAMEA